MPSTRVVSACAYGDAGRRATSRTRSRLASVGGRGSRTCSRAVDAAGQDRIYAVDPSGQLLSYGDAGTPGNVSDPVTVGFGGWQGFTHVFAGRDAAGHDRIYAVVA